MINKFLTKLLLVIIFTAIVILLMYFTVPQLIEPFLYSLKMFWNVFESLFMDSLVTRIGIVIMVSIIFGSVSYKRQNIIVGFIGAIVDLIILFA